MPVPASAAVERFLATPDILTTDPSVRAKAVRALAEVVDESFGLKGFENFFR